MKWFKKILFPITCLVVVATFAVIGPRAVKAAVATLVQVVNTAQNPVVTQEVSPQLLLDQAISPGSNYPGIVTTTPLDVSGMKQVRVNVTFTGACSGSTQESVFLRPAHGTDIALDTLANGCDTFTKTYDMPGGQLYVLTQGFTQTVNVQIYGR